MNDIRTCVDLGVPSRVPMFALSEEFDVKWLNEADYEETALNVDQLARAMIESIKEFDYDWAWLQVDDCIEFEPLGVGTKGEGNILRATCDYLPAAKETLADLKMPDPHRDGRMPILLEAIRRVRDESGDTVCVCGRTAAPFSSTSLLYGIGTTMMLTITDPELLKETNEFFIDLQTMWGRAQFEAGAHALWVGDCNAMSNLISLNHYTEFAFDSCKKLIENYNHIGVLSLFHASEEASPYIEKQRELGASALSVGPGAEIAAVKEITAGKVALMGNLDPVNVLQNGTPEQVASETARIVETAKPNGGYIFSTGEMTPRDTPEENVRAMIRTAREHGVYNDQ